MQVRRPFCSDTPPLHVTMSQCEVDAKYDVINCHPLQMATGPANGPDPEVHLSRIKSGKPSCCCTPLFCLVSYSFVCVSLFLSLCVWFSVLTLH